MHITPPLRATLATQMALAHRDQLYAAGVSRAELRWALGRSARLVLPGVVLIGGGSLDARQRLVAAGLYVGSPAQLAGLSAVRYLGLADSVDDGVLRFVLPQGRSLRSAGFVRIRRTWRPDARPWTRDGMEVCSPPRAVVDAARELRHVGQARALVVGAVQRRLVTTEQLLAEVEAGSQRGSAVVRRAVAEAGSGAWSVAESAVLTGLSRSRVLPRVWPNPMLSGQDGQRLPSPDGWIDEVGLAIQVHSREHHLRDQDWEGTVQGDTLLGSYGVPVIAVTPAGYAADRLGFVRRVEASYQRLLALGHRPAVVMRPRGPGLIPAT